MVTRITEDTHVEAVNKIVMRRGYTRVGEVELHFNRKNSPRGVMVVLIIVKRSVVDAIKVLYALK